MADSYEIRLRAPDNVLDSIYGDVDGTVPLMSVADYRSWDAPYVPSRHSA
jgi:hypothetical protein